MYLYDTKNFNEKRKENGKEKYVSDWFDENFRFSLSFFLFMKFMKLYPISASAGEQNKTQTHKISSHYALPAPFYSRLCLIWEILKQMGCFAQNRNHETLHQALWRMCQEMENAVHLLSKGHFHLFLDLGYSYANQFFEKSTIIFIMKKYIHYLGVFCQHIIAFFKRLFL